jgi:hypothetical protein
VTDPNASGWHPDPAGVHHQRYWTGDEWTARVADAYGVIAVHHLDGDHAPPGGGPVIPAAARAAAPALSLVTPVEVVAQPVEVVPLPVEEAAIEVAPPAPPEVAVPVPAVPPVAGWFPDPCGIHCERSWDGAAWSAVVVDRNRFVLEHPIRDSYPGPIDAPMAQPPASVPRRLDLVAGVRGLDPAGAGWQLDETGPCRERYVVDGHPSEVVRTARGRTG